MLALSAQRRRAFIRPRIPCRRTVDRRLRAVSGLCGTQGAHRAGRRPAASHSLGQRVGGATCRRARDGTQGLTTKGGDVRQRNGRSPHCDDRPLYRAGRASLRACCRMLSEDYLRWFETSLVISNIDTCFLPPKTCFSLSSALIRRLLIESCSLFFLM